MNTTINFFYTTYKGEGARKLVKRVQEHFVGISRQNIQNFINTNQEHCCKRTQFKNKPPLAPVISHSVNGRWQIDLVSFEKDPKIKDDQIFCQVLSVIDVFSRFLVRRPATSKEPGEIKELMIEIFK